MSAIFQRGLNNIKVPHHKETAACHTVLTPDPPRVAIPVSRHTGAICEPLVSVGRRRRRASIRRRRTYRDLVVCQKERPWKNYTRLPGWRLR